MADSTTHSDAPQLEGGTYEILRNRLKTHGAELRARLDRLNAERKAVLRDRCLQVLDDLRARLGEKELNHLLSSGVLEPVHRFAFSQRPTVYPPPEPDE